MTQDQPLITREFVVKVRDEARQLAWEMKKVARQFQLVGLKFREQRQELDRRAARHRPGQARRDGLTARQYRAHKRHLNRTDRALRKAHR